MKTGKSYVTRDMIREANRALMSHHRTHTQRSLSPAVRAAQPTLKEIIEAGNKALAALRQAELADS